MNAKEIREKTLIELEKMDVELRKDLFAKRLQHSSGQLADTSELNKLRKDIARIQFISAEKASKKDK